MVSKIVSSQTTIAELQSFLKDAGPGTLRGKDLGDGTFKIHIDKGKFGDKIDRLLDDMKGKTAKRTKDAAEGINLVMKSFLDRVDASGSMESNAVKRLMGRIELRTDKSVLTTKAMNKLASDVKLTGEKLGLSAHFDPGTGPVEPEEKKRARGPEPHLMPSTRDVNALAGHVLDAGDPAKRETAIDGIADRMAAVLESTTLSKEDVRALAMSTGDAFRRDIAGLVRDRLTSLGETPPSDLTGLVDEAFGRFADKTLGTRQSGPIEPVRLPSTPKGQDGPSIPSKIEIQGKTYEPVKELGSGGFAKVYLYADPKNPKDTVAFKVFEQKTNGPDADSIRGTTIDEVLLHERALASGSENILKLEGVVRLSNGMLGVALETAPHGTLYDTATTMHYLTAEGSSKGGDKGRMSRAEANTVGLTWLEGFLKGNLAIEKEKILHLDNKSPNVMIGKDGTPKIIDFGLARLTKKIQFGDMPNVDNQSYLSPELMNEKRRIADDGKKELGRRKDDIDEMVDLFTTSKTKEKAKSNLVSDLSTPIQKRHEADLTNQSAVEIDSKHDMWGTFISAVEIFSGQTLFPETKSPAELEDRIKAWMQDPNSVVVAPPGTKPPLPKNALMFSTGDAKIDDLLSKMGAKDPARRLSFDQALKHEAFSRKGVGDPTVKEFGTRLGHPGAANQNVDAKKTTLGYSINDMVNKITARFDSIKDQIPTLTKERLAAKDITREEVIAFAKLMPEDTEVGFHQEFRRYINRYDEVTKAEASRDVAMMDFADDLAELRKSGALG